MRSSLIWAVVIFKNQRGGVRMDTEALPRFLLRHWFSLIMNSRFQNRVGLSYILLQLPCYRLLVVTRRAQANRVHIL